MVAGSDKVAEVRRKTGFHASAWTDDPRRRINYFTEKKRSMKLLKISYFRDMMSETMKL